MCSVDCLLGINYKCSILYYFYYCWYLDLVLNFFPAIAELGDFPAKDLSENSQAGCEGRLPAYRRAWFPPVLRCECRHWNRFSSNACANIGKNAKSEKNWNDDWAQCVVCNDVQTFALVSLYTISIVGGVLKRKIDVYIFWHEIRGLTLNPNRRWISIGVW